VVPVVLVVVVVSPGVVGDVDVEADVVLLPPRPVPPVGVVVEVAVLVVVVVVVGRPQVGHVPPVVVVEGVEYVVVE
jgi:hypothetical protein